MEFPNCEIGILTFTEDFPLDYFRCPICDSKLSGLFVESWEEVIGED